MPIKKAIIILIISALILAIIFVFIYYQKSFESNLSKPESGEAASRQKSLTSEEKGQKLFKALETLNSQSGQAKQNLTPSQEQAKKQELLNTLKVMDNKAKGGQLLSPAEEQKKKQELLNLLKLLK